MEREHRELKGEHLFRQRVKPHNIFQVIMKLRVRFKIHPGLKALKLDVECQTLQQLESLVAHEFFFPNEQIEESIEISLNGQVRILSINTLDTLKSDKTRHPHTDTPHRFLNSLSLSQRLADTNSLCLSARCNPPTTRHPFRRFNMGAQPLPPSSPPTNGRGWPLHLHTTTNQQQYGRQNISCFAGSTRLQSRSFTLTSSFLSTLHCARYHAGDWLHLITITLIIIVIIVAKPTSSSSLSLQGLLGLPLPRQAPLYMARHSHHTNSMYTPMQFHKQYSTSGFIHSWRS